jgi:hypothetical protein
LKKDEKWFVNDYEIEVLNEINYLGVFWKVMGVGTDKGVMWKQKVIRRYWP